MRYNRQEILKEIGRFGQAKLKKAKVAIVGLGALGSVSAEILARAGIGNLALIDRDFVELSNLQRQLLFDEYDIGKPKAEAAYERLRTINSAIKIDFYIDDIDHENIEEMLKRSDIILDCTDNLETRFLLNDFCVKNKVPLIYAAGASTKGYIFNMVSKKTACLRCFLDNSKSVDTCETSGVLGSLTSIIGSIQSKEAMKIILGGDFEKNLLFVDAWNNGISKIKVNKKSDCQCCVKKNFEFLSGKKQPKTVKICGSNIWQIKNNPLSKGQYNKIKKSLEKIGSLGDFGNCINFDGKLTLFRDGRALIKAKSEKEAKTLYSKFVGN